MSHITQCLCGSFHNNCAHTDTQTDTQTDTHRHACIKAASNAMCRIVLFHLQSVADSVQEAISGPRWVFGNILNVTVETLCAENTTEDTNKDTQGHTLCGVTRRQLDTVTGPGQPSVGR